MAELNLNPDYVKMLTLKIGALMGKEGLVMPDPGSNPTDDPMSAELQDLPDDQSRQEVIAEIKGLSRDEQAELVALMWLGREDTGPEEWDSLVEQAKERRETPTWHYLLDHPQVAEYILNGLDLLGEGPEVSGVEEI